MKGVNKSFFLCKLVVVSFTLFGAAAWAKTDKYVLELSWDKNFSESVYINNYEGCEEKNQFGENVGKGEATDCFRDTPTGRTPTHKTKEECTETLKYLLEINTGKYLDKNKDSIVILDNDGEKRYMRCIAYDFDKLLDL